MAKLEFEQLQEGQTFPPISYKLEDETVAGFLEATEDSTSLYRDSDLVPPMLLAARAMAAMMECVATPPGSIHVSQELEFLKTVIIGQTINCHAWIKRKQERGRLRVANVGLDVFNEAGEKVLTAGTSFMLPLPG